MIFLLLSNPRRLMRSTPPHGDLVCHRISTTFKIKCRLFNGFLFFFSLMFPYAHGTHVAGLKRNFVPEPPVSPCSLHTPADTSDSLLLLLIKARRVSRRSGSSRDLISPAQSRLPPKGSRRVNGIETVCIARGQFLRWCIDMHEKLVRASRTTTT